MRKHRLEIAIGMALAAGPATAAWQGEKEAPAPVPAQIPTAKRAFLSNAGGVVNHNAPPPGTGFSGGPDRAYNQFYAAVKKTGEFELAAAPAEADVILEIRFDEPYYWLGKGDIAVDPQIRLVIRDPRTHTALWGITEHIGGGLLQRSRDNNLGLAVQDAVKAVLALRRRTP